MKKIIISLISNAIALFAAAYLIKGFQITMDWETFALVVVIFTALNVFVRPFLKLILTPIIILTLGLGIIVVNAIILYLLDYFSQNVSIDNIKSLILATLIISAINVITHYSAKKEE